MLLFSLFSQDNIKLWTKWDFRPKFRWELLFRIYVFNTYVCAAFDNMYKVYKLKNLTVYIKIVLGIVCFLLCIFEWIVNIVNMDTCWLKKARCSAAKQHVGGIILDASCLLYLFRYKIWITGSTIDGSVTYYNQSTESTHRRRHHSAY